MNRDAVIFKHVISLRKKMPKDNTPAMPGAGNKNPERDFIVEMNQVILSCALSSQLMDLREMEEYLRKSRSVYTAAEKAGYEYIGFLKILQLIVQVLASNAQMNAFQLEARFTDALEKGQAIVDDSKQALQILDQEVGPDETDENLLETKKLLEYYNTIGPASLAYIQAEQVGVSGRLDEYRTALLYAADLFGQVANLAYSENPTLKQLYAFGTNMAERLTNRARYFEYVQREKTNRYMNPEGKKVFIIHGHSDDSAMLLQQMLKEQLKLESVILKNEASSGESVIEKFEGFARDCGYAFAIITGDDLVKKDGEKYFQARPNVLFELGWFYGRYGRSRVCMIREEGTQIPSDLSGIISLGFTKNIKEVYLDMCTELKAAGLIA